MTIFAPDNARIRTIKQAKSIADTQPAQSFHLLFRSKKQTIASTLPKRTAD